MEGATEGFGNAVGSIINRMRSNIASIIRRKLGKKDAAIADSNGARKADGTGLKSDDEASTSRKPGKNTARDEKEEKEQREANTRRCKLAMQSVVSTANRSLSGTKTGSGLARIEADLARAAADAKNCPEAEALLAQLRATLDNASNSLLSDAQAVVGSCKLNVLKAMANNVGALANEGAFEVIYQRLKKRIKDIRKVKAAHKIAYAEYVASFKAGSVDGMEDALVRTQDALSSDVASQCFPKARAGLKMRRGKVSKLRDRADKVARAIASCDPARISKARKRLKRRKGPISTRFRAQLKNAAKACRENETPEAMRARLNRKCKKKPGYVLGKISPDGGTYWCKPTQKTANRKCVKNNREPGWVAVNITSKGAFECRRKQTNQPEQPQLAGRWIATSSKHVSDKGWQRSNGVWYLDITVNQAGTGGRVSSVWSKTRKSLLGNWRFVGNRLIEVAWADSTILRYRINRLDSTSAEIMKTNNNLRVRYRKQ